MCTWWASSDSVLKRLSVDVDEDCEFLVIGTPLMYRPLPSVTPCSGVS